MKIHEHITYQEVSLLLKALGWALTNWKAEEEIKEAQQLASKLLNYQIRAQKEREVKL